MSDAWRAYGRTDDTGGIGADTKTASTEACDEPLPIDGCARGPSRAWAVDLALRRLDRVSQLGPAHHRKVGISAFALCVGRIEPDGSHARCLGTRDIRVEAIA